MGNNELIYYHRKVKYLNGKECLLFVLFTAFAYGAGAVIIIMVGK